MSRSAGQLITYCATIHPLVQEMSNFLLGVGVGGGGERRANIICKLTIDLYNGANVIKSLSTLGTVP